jgi:hypothetical protein
MIQDVILSSRSLGGRFVDLDVRAEARALAVRSAALDIAEYVSW